MSLLQVPIFNKKEEYLQILFDFSVPNSNAAWYLKMSVAYHQTQNENRKAPRRHLNDPSLGKINLSNIHSQHFLQNLNGKTSSIGGKKLQKNDT